MNTILGMFVLLYPFSLWIVIFIGTLIAAVIIGKIASAKGKNGFRWGFSVIGLVALYTFWDWPLTVIAHKYYCEKEAGFWVYKTLEQWKAENPGVFETLVANDVGKGSIINIGGREYEMINQRIALGGNFYDNKTPLFRIFIEDYELLDTKNGEILVKRIEYSARAKNKFKIWNNIEYCDNHNGFIERMELFNQQSRNYRGFKK